MPDPRFMNERVTILSLGRDRRISFPDRGNQQLYFQRLQRI